MRFDHEFEAIYIRYSDKIYRFLYLKTNNPYLAEDITAEVFLRAWKKWDTIKRDYIQALLFKIAQNILIDYWRKEKHKKEFSLETSIEAGYEPSYDEDLVHKLQSEMDGEMLKKAMETLPEKLKDVLILRFMEELSAKEAADILNTSEGNIRVLQYRALTKLKEALNGK